MVRELMPGVRLWDEVSQKRRLSGGQREPTRIEDCQSSASRSTAAPSSRFYLPGRVKKTGNRVAISGPRLTRICGSGKFYEECPEQEFATKSPGDLCGGMLPLPGANLEISENVRELPDQQSRNPKFHHPCDCIPNRHTCIL
jgi:hypothetical protein